MIHQHLYKFLYRDDESPCLLIAPAATTWQFLAYAILFASRTVVTPGLSCLTEGMTRTQSS
jgi:hypothetical protein